MTTDLSKLRELDQRVTWSEGLPWIVENGELSRSTEAQSIALKLAQHTSDLLAEIERLRAENSTLAAGACIYPNGDGLIGDERGNAVCAKDATIERLTAERDELKAQKWAVKHTDTANDMVLMGLARDAAAEEATRLRHELTAAREALAKIENLPIGLITRAYSIARAALRSGAKEG